MELVLNSAAVTTLGPFSPRHNGPIGSNSRESIFGGLKLLHITELLLNFTDVGSKLGVPPGYDTPICTYGSEDLAICLDPRSAPAKDARP